MRRREFITGLGAAAWPLAGRAQQPAMPLIGFVSGRSPDDSARLGAAFRKGLSEAGYIEGQNVTVEYHWLEGQYDRVPGLTADLIRRRVAVVATVGNAPAVSSARAAQGKVPIVFGVGDDPVKLGLVASLARPGSNLTGINFFTNEAAPKRLGLLHEMVPGANRIAVLVNPSNDASTQATLRELKDAASLIGLSIESLRAGTSGEIAAAFETIKGKRIEALFVAGDGYFVSRRVQFATLATSHGIPTSVPSRENVEAGGLMSYGVDLADVYRQVGDYAGQILKGAKPVDLPVAQSIRFELVINLKTARALGLAIPPTLIALADEVIE
jgi:putative ABC transport system substrate-binding protein